jgi:hypothetical protein
MITAMQELIDKIILESNSDKPTEQQKYILIWVKYMADDLLEKEKEQIIKSHIDGFDHIVAEFKKQEYAEEYFNKTYKNQAP